MYIKYQIFQRRLLHKLFSEAEIRESDLKICILKFEICNLIFWLVQVRVDICGVLTDGSARFDIINCGH